MLYLYCSKGAERKLNDSQIQDPHQKAKIQLHCKPNEASRTSLSQAQRKRGQAR